MQFDIHSKIRDLADDSKDLRKLLEICPDINIKDNKGNTPLIIAAIWGKDKTIEALLKRQAEINIQNVNGDTALSLGAEEGHVKSIEILLQNGADLDIADKYGMTPLMWAAWSVRLECIKLLIKSGANVNVRCVNGRTALTYAKGEIPPHSVSYYTNQLQSSGRFTSKMQEMLEDIKLHQKLEREYIILYLVENGAIE
jgi:ankyrin repeat protein